MTLCMGLTIINESGLYNGISGIGAMLAGFGFSSLRMSFPDHTSSVVQICYLAFTATAIGLELCAILNAATCSVFGPGKFLRGKGGLAAAEKAVQVLEDKSEITLGYFLGGLICILISSSMKAFIQYHFLNALVVSIGLVGMGYLLIHSGKYTNLHPLVTNFESLYFSQVEGSSKRCMWTRIRRSRVKSMQIKSTTPQISDSHEKRR